MPVKYLAYTSLNWAKSFKIGTGCLQDGAEVFHNLLTLLANVGADNCAGDRIQRNLAGGENKVIGDDRLRVRTDSCGSIVGMNFFHEKLPPFFSTLYRGMKAETPDCGTRACVRPTNTYFVAKKADYTNVYLPPLAYFHYTSELYFIQ